MKGLLINVSFLHFSGAGYIISVQWNDEHEHFLCKRLSKKMRIYLDLLSLYDYGNTYNISTHFK